MKGIKSKVFNAKTGQIIVIGASAGGLKVLIELIAQLPENYPFPILIIWHISADAAGNVLPDALNRAWNLKSVHPVHGEMVKADRTCPLMCSIR